MCEERGGPGEGEGEGRDRRVNNYRTSFAEKIRWNQHFMTPICMRVPIPPRTSRLSLPSSTLLVHQSLLKHHTMSADDSKQDAALSKLSTILERLETTPHNVTLIKDQIHLMLQLQMTSEVLDATLNLASLVMLSEGE